MESNIPYASEITDYWSFIMNIDWRDPLLIGLVTMHILTTIAALLSRNHINFQTFLYFTLLAVAYFSEQINHFAALNWHSFAKQPYFDTKGLFILTVFTIPILFNCSLLMGTWIYNSIRIMLRLRTAQLKDRMREERLNQHNLISKDYS